MRFRKLDRKSTIYSAIVTISLIFIFFIFSLNAYYKKNEVKHLNYKENSKVDYNVQLKQNEYYELNYLKQNKQYISSLIENIKAEFKYDFNMQDNIEYNYNYNIDAYVTVIEQDTNKEIYSSSEILIDNVEGKTTKNLIINEQLNIDYNKYNDKINNFVQSYNLKNVDCLLSIRFNIKINGISEKFTKEEQTISLRIPLTQNTVSIDIANNQSNKSIVLKQHDSKGILFLILAILLFIAVIILTIILIIYIKITQTDEDKYNIEIKRILNNYGSYISNIQDEFDTTGYQLLKVKKFVDLLDIRDTIHQPIIMIENKETLSSCFIIPTTNKILYFYSLGVVQYALPGVQKNTTEKDMGDVNV